MPLIAVKFSARIVVIHLTALYIRVNSLQTGRGHMQHQYTRKARVLISRLNTLIEQSCKYSNNAVKCITTILALNLTAIKGTSIVNCSSYWETLSLYAHCNLISFMFVLRRMQNYTIHHSLHYQSKKSMLICTHDIVVNSVRRYC